jgi:hypothetical protein
MTVTCATLRHLYLFLPCVNPVMVKSFQSRTHVLFLHHSNKSTTAGDSSIKFNRKWNSHSFGRLFRMLFSRHSQPAVGNSNDTGVFHRAPVPIRLPSPDCTFRSSVVRVYARARAHRSISKKTSITISSGAYSSCRSGDDESLFVNLNLPRRPRSVGRSAPRPATIQVFSASIGAALFRGRNLRNIDCCHRVLNRGGGFAGRDTAEKIENPLRMHNRRR